MNKNLQISIEEKIKKRITKILDDRIMIVDDCNQIISYAYQWVELRDLKESFPTVVFYRNWIQHTRLTGKVINKKILEFFKEIYKQFSIPESKKSTSDYIAEQLSTKKLRNELKQIFEKISCNFFVLDSLKMWKQFMGCLCNELLNKPLEIEKKDIKKILDERYSPGNYLMPYRLVLINENSQIFFEIQICNLTIDSKGKNSDSIFPRIPIRGKFPLDEFRESFLKD